MPEYRADGSRRGARSGRPNPEGDRLDRLLAALGNAFLVSFALDAALTLADELLRATLGTPLLAPARDAVARLPLALAPALAVALPLAPGLPARVFLPPLLFLAWALLGALPLAASLPPRPLGLALGALQVALAAAAFLALRRHPSSRRWLLHRDRVARARLRPGRTLLLLASATVAIPLALAGYGLLALAFSIEQATGGFMRFDLRGISAGEREYARGAQQVRLVGMLHLGEAGAYRELFASFGPDALVLAEGVSDREHRLASRLPYEAIAGPLGLDVQPPIAEALAEAARAEGAESAAEPEVVRADVDASEFSPETLAFLRDSAQLLTSPDLRTWLARARELGRRFDAAASERVLLDILTRRNEHLVAALDAALADGHERIVVPWGALHLPEIEKALLARGFERRAETRRPLVHYATLLGALEAAREHRAPDVDGG